MLSQTLLDLEQRLTLPAGATYLLNSKPARIVSIVPDSCWHDRCHNISRNT